MSTTVTRVSAGDRRQSPAPCAAIHTHSAQAAPHCAASCTILHVPSVKQSYHRDTAAVRGGQARGEDVSRVQSDVWTGVIRDIMQGSTLAQCEPVQGGEREKTTSPCDRISIIIVLVTARILAGPRIQSDVTTSYLPLDPYLLSLCGQCCVAR